MGPDGVLLYAEGHIRGHNEADAQLCKAFSFISWMDTRRNRGWDPKAYYCMSRVTSPVSTQ